MWWLRRSNLSDKKLIQETSTKRVQDEIQLCGEGDRPEIVKKNPEIWPYCLIVYAQTRIRRGEWDAQNSEIQTDHLTPDRRTDLGIYRPKQKKKRTCRIDDFAVTADHGVEIEDNDKRDKYLDLARELKKLWRWQWYHL